MTIASMMTLLDSLMVFQNSVSRRLIFSENDGISVVGESETRKIWGCPISGRFKPGEGDGDGSYLDNSKKFTLKLLPLACFTSLV